MQSLDMDLRSIQETRDLIARAKEAQKILATMSQEQIDRIVKAIADAGAANAEKLAKMANQETGFGKWEDKIVKNLFASKVVYETLKDTKTVGIINEDPAHKVMDVAVPMGVIAGLIPSTNPTSTVIYKAMISIKGANSIVVSPHPNAKNAILETVRVIKEAAVAAGCPADAIGCMTIPTLQSTDTLMKHPDTAMILATGGSAMVKAAYSSGTPAIGVGPGNGPAFIDKSADVRLAVKRILDSKTFDNGTICASEQSIVIERAMEATVVRELEAQGAYMLTAEQAEKLSHFIMRANGTMNPQIVGKSVEAIVQLAGLTGVPTSARVLVARETQVGPHAPYSKEKLTPILAFYVEENVEAVSDRCYEILIHEGAGHTFSMHANDDALVRKFALRMPVSRMLINTPSALGGIGGSTNLIPALTLGCGAVGGSSTGNNIGPLDLINVRKVAYGVKEIEELRPQQSVTPVHYNVTDTRFSDASCADTRFSDVAEAPTTSYCTSFTEDVRFQENTVATSNEISEEKVADIIREVLAQFKK
ncbi:MAG: acetaldehyde dehydrogenase (acetylating) [Cellulosilyticaceae bacterium]